MKFNRLMCIAFLLGLFVAGSAMAQDMLPYDNGIATYHTSPRYRESESHPFRIAAYVLHPIGWVAREVIFRPFSYFASSTEVTRSVLGYREPYDYRQPECFSADDSIPDCRAVMPYNYDAASGEEPETASLVQGGVREVYLPDVNFDFDVRTLSDLGRGQVRRMKQMLDTEPNLRIVLEGHTDYKGADAYNEKLGMDRAEAVRQELIKLGVSADRLSTVTFGKSKPVFADQENWARAVNRRVQVNVEGTDSAAAPVAAGGTGEWKDAN